MMMAMMGAFAVRVTDNPFGQSASLFSWFVWSSSRPTGKDVRDLIFGPLRTCRVSKVVLHHSCVEQNLPLITNDMLKRTKETIKRMSQERGEDLFKAHGLAERECIVHCGLSLYFDKQPNCDELGIYIEHNADINWYVLDKMNPNPKQEVVWEVGHWQVQDGRCPDRLTIYNLMLEMYRRDPAVQEFDLIDKNCCHWADKLLALLVPHGRLQDLLQQHGQEYDAIKEGFTATLGEGYASGAMGLVKFVASHSHQNHDAALFHDLKDKLQPQHGNKFRPLCPVEIYMCADVDGAEVIDSNASLCTCPHHQKVFCGTDAMEENQFNVLQLLEKPGCFAPYCAITPKPSSTTTSTLTEEGQQGSKFACHKGQGESFKYFLSTADNSFAACAQRCREHGRCDGFDYTLNAKKDACRLYIPNQQRENDAGWDDRRYCANLDTSWM